jgi:hypothetical protein
MTTTTYGLRCRVHSPVSTAIHLPVVGFEPNQSWFRTRSTRRLPLDRAAGRLHPRDRTKKSQDRPTTAAEQHATSQQADPSRHHTTSTTPRSTSGRTHSPDPARTALRRRSGFARWRRAASGSNSNSGRAAPRRTWTRSRSRGHAQPRAPGAASRPARRERPAAPCHRRGREATIVSEDPVTPDSGHLGDCMTCWNCSAT